MATPDVIAARESNKAQTAESGANQAGQQPLELENLSYALLLLGFSLLAVFNVALLFLAQDPVIQGVIEIIDVPLTVIFFVDFVIRFRDAKSKARYFFLDFGWADLLASLPVPVLKLFRVFRMVHAWRIIRHYGARNARRQIRQHRADTALAILAFLIICVLEFGGIFVVLAERVNPDANIKTASDALWWAFVTITTVGYGDRYPTTNWGRIVGIVLLTTGVALFGVLTGYLANAFLAPPKQGEDSKQATLQTTQTMQKPEQPDSQAMLVELQRLISEQEKAQEELREILAELKQVTH